MSSRAVRRADTLEAIFAELPLSDDRDRSQAEILERGLRVELELRDLDRLRLRLRLRLEQSPVHEV